MEREKSLLEYTIALEKSSENKLQTQLNINLILRNLSQHWKMRCLL